MQGEKAWPLFIHGPTGTGKTSAALCLADHCGGSWFLTATQFMQEWADCVCGRFIDAESKSNVSTTLYRNRIAKCPLLVVDDAGLRDRVSETNYEAFKLVLDLRENRPLVVTSNLNAAAIAAIYDDRIADRLSAGTVIELAGKSRRRAA